MKKGLLKYKYPGPLMLNIGDYVQSLATLEHIKEYDVLIDREHLDKVEEDTRIVLNGGFSHRNKTFPASDKIHPLFVSFHINKKEYLTDEGIKYLKKYKPIGCRDQQTADGLNESGVEAYFSGCMTLTFNKVDTPRKGILFVLDNVTIKGKKILDFETFLKGEHSQMIIEELIKEFSMDEIRNATFIKQGKNPLFKSEEDKFDLARGMLNEFASHEFVVTTRIHTLMPSMSKGTRALFIMRDNQDPRFNGLKQFGNYIDVTNGNNIHKQINRLDGKIINNEGFRKFVKPMVDKVKEFMK